jgi:hypothetical protein
MKAYEFALRLNEQGTVELPPQVKAAIEAGAQAKLIVLVEEFEDEEKAWEEMAAREFFKGYSQADSIYDTDAVIDTKNVLEKVI